jgi:hypothetical protein
METLYSIPRYYSLRINNRTVRFYTSSTFHINLTKTSSFISLEPLLRTLQGCEYLTQDYSILVRSVGIDKLSGIQIVIFRRKVPHLLRDDEAMSEKGRPESCANPNWREIPPTLERRTRWSNGVIGILHEFSPSPCVHPIQGQLGAVIDIS